MFCNYFCASAIHWCIIALISGFRGDQRSCLIWKKVQRMKKNEARIVNVKNWHRRRLLLPSERLIRSVTAAITGIRISMSSYSLNIKSVASFTIWLIFSFPKFINCKFHLTNKTMWVMCYHIYTHVHVPPIQWHRILFVNTKRITVSFTAFNLMYNI